MMTNVLCTHTLLCRLINGGSITQVQFRLDSLAIRHRLDTNLGLILTQVEDLNPSPPNYYVVKFLTIMPHLKQTMICVIFIIMIIFLTYLSSLAQLLGTQPTYPNYLTNLTTYLPSLLLAQFNYTHNVTCLAQLPTYPTYQT